MSIVDVPTRDRVVIGGVDTHLETHVVAALDPIGGVLDVATFGTDLASCVALADWLESLGPLRVVGVEGTSSYGAGLTRHLRGRGIEVREVSRPNRQERRKKGKSDPVDAVAAARAVLAGEGTIPKTMDGNVEAIRALLVVKRSARKQRTAAITQIRQLLVTAPAELRSRYDGLSPKAVVATATSLRPDSANDPVTAETKAAIRHLARRVGGLDREIADVAERLSTIVTDMAPLLLARRGVGPDTAGTLLVTAGDNPERLHSEAAWARLCGVAPVEASSGKVTRHRLNRGGDRNANNALWRIVMVRLGVCPRTQVYSERRSSEGRSKKEIIRCLKRYVARELYPYIINPH